MSTKIYDAYAFTDTPSLYELRLRMARLRKTSHKILRDIFLHSVAQLSSMKIDEKILGIEEPKGVYEGQCLINAVIDEIEQRENRIKKTGERDPLHDYSFEVEIIPIKNKILLMPFTERRELIKLLSRQKYLKFYGYWNNTDPDENCTEKEWEQRHKDWDEALPWIGIPAQNGFSVTLSPPCPHWPEYPSCDMIIPLMPDFEERVRRRANRQGWINMTDRIHKEEIKKDSSASPITSCMKAERALVESEEGKKEIERLTLEYSQKLPREITKELLMQEL
jgi:hypothetical protein